MICKEGGKMDPKQQTVITIMKDINENQLLLPHFQRDFNWKPDKQKALIASFLYNIPIGSILLLRTRTDMSTKNDWI